MSGKVTDNLGRSSGLVKAVPAGRAGTVDWDTTPKTGTVTAASGNGYFVNTAAAVRTVNLPAGSAGSIVAIADYTRTFNTNNCTVSPNGSEKIGGVAADATLSVNGQSATFVYVDGTEGWVNVQETETSQAGAVPFIVACGGSESTSGDYKIHTFTGDGTFTVTNAGLPSGSTTVDYMVIAGGGSGGATNGPNATGGGGAGGYRESPGAASGCYTASPLGASPAVALPVSVQGYPIDVGGGAAAPPGTAACATQGEASTFSSITSAGGGKGGKTSEAGGAGGSGGGGGGGSAGGRAGGAGNTPPTSPAQGFVGGIGGSPPPDRQGGGGGGATAQGVNAIPGASGAGGAGATSSINATPTARAGGGGAGASADATTGGAGGAGNPGGAGGNHPAAGGAGTANTGGGGGGGATSQIGGAGGSGIVIIRYKYQ